MSQQLFAYATVLALAAGMTTSAIALDYDGGVHSGRFEGVRGFNGWRHGDWDGRRFRGGYGRHYEDEYGRGRSGLGAGTYCPALSRCGAGLPD